MSSDDQRWTRGTVPVVAGDPREGIGRKARMNSQQMQRMHVDGGELEFAIVGPADGEPVLLIHGAFVAEAYAPLCAEPALAARYRLVRYHRRGWGRSSRLPAG